MCDHSDPPAPEQEPPVPGLLAVEVTPELLEGYQAALLRRRMPVESRKTYQRALQVFYDRLPEGKQVDRAALLWLREQLLEAGYAVRTVNVVISVANSFLDWLGRRDLQLMGQLKTGGGTSPEITRSEYLRLLRTARDQGKEQAYLMVKLFASTGLQLQALPRVTAQAVRRGSVPLGQEGGELRLPECLRQELLDYAQRLGVKSGPIFVSRSGRPLSRAVVSNMIRCLCPEARVPEEKGNPRSLRRLYIATNQEIRSGLERLATRTMDSLLENEQLAIGWKAEGVNAPSEIACF